MIDAAIAKRIRLVGMDVDGTLTDGGLYIGGLRGGAQIELKRFDIQDGLGVKLLKQAGLRTAIVTGRAGDASRIRADEMGIDDFVVSGGRKLPAFAAILEKQGVSWDETCFVGDDLIDLPIMKRAGLRIAVGNAVAEVKACAQFTTTASGGRGALREFVEAFLRARGCWDSTVGTWLRERGGDVAD